jgi:integrase
MPTKPTMSTQDMLQAAELYLAQVEKYEEVTLRHLAEFLGVGIMVVNRWLPTPQWERLRNAWIQERLRRAMDMVCAEAKIQDDFTVERIASLAGLPSSVVHRALPEEWKSRHQTLPITGKKGEHQEQPSIMMQYIHQAEAYLAQTEKYEEVTEKHFAQFLGEAKHIVYRRLPNDRWEELRNKWIENRLRQAIDATYAEARTQDDFTVENIVTHAGMPYITVCRFLCEDEWRARRATLPIRQKTSETTSRYLAQAESYLARTEHYEDVTVKRLAEFLGVTRNTVTKRLSNHQWEELRKRWIESRLRWAMDVAYAQAKTRDDFTLAAIIRLAGVPSTTVRRYLSQDEWHARKETISPKSTSPSSQVETRPPKEARPSKVASGSRSSLQRTVQKRSRSLGESPKSASTLSQEETHPPKSISSSQQLERDKPTRSIPHDPERDVVCLQQLRQALDTVYTTSKTQDDFTMRKIMELTGISQKRAYRLIGDEWRTRRATLPTTREKVLAALQRLVDANTPVLELTRKRIVELADVNGDGTWPWFSQPLNAARRQLASSSRKQAIDPPSGMNVREIPGGWIDIDASIWDLRPAGRRLLRRERLREDFAEVGWSLLQEELRSPDIALGTVEHHYQGFLKAAAVLGDEVSDVRRATLEAVQRAWMSFNGTQGLRAMVRTPLAMTFEALMRLAEQDDAIEGREMLRIFAWLSDDVTIGSSKPGEEFLSENEVNAVIRDCLSDIIAGIAYTDANPDLLAISLHPLARENAAVVVQWGTALMLLIMVFTGLRRESVLGLKTDDWAEVRSGLYVLAWRHNKKVEEHVAVLPALLGQQLQLYVERTAQVRAALEIESVFLGSDPRGLWQVLPLTQFRQRLQGFAKRHHLEREGKALTLNNTALRRTYTTRALYEGRNLAALRAQLGHMYLDSTLRYAKFDRHEHPAEVGVPLDEYGRKALTLWQTPRILDELDPGERTSLLSVKVQRKQDVGLCGHSRCVKAIGGSPPPCSLCEHLVTSPEFFNVWEMEYRWRKQELERLAVEPGSEMMLAQMIFQFECFEANFAFIQKRFRP